MEYRKLTLRHLDSNVTAIYDFHESDDEKHKRNNRVRDISQRDYVS